MSGLCRYFILVSIDCHFMVYIKILNINSHDIPVFKNHKTVFELKGQKTRSFNDSIGKYLGLTPK